MFAGSNRYLETSAFPYGHETMPQQVQQLKSATLGLIEYNERGKYA